MTSAVSTDQNLDIHREVVIHRVYLFCLSNRVAARRDQHAIDMSPVKQVEHMFKLPTTFQTVKYRLGSEG